MFPSIPLHKHNCFHLIYIWAFPSIPLHKHNCFQPFFYTWAFPSIPLHTSNCFPPFSIHGRSPQFLYINAILFHPFLYIDVSLNSFTQTQLFSTLFYTWAFPSIPLHKRNCFPPFSIRRRFPQFLYTNTIVFHLFLYMGVSLYSFT